MRYRGKIALLSILSVIPLHDLLLLSLLLLSRCQCRCWLLLLLFLFVVYAVVAAVLYANDLFPVQRQAIDPNDDETWMELTPEERFARGHKLEDLIASCGFAGETCGAS